MQGTLSISNDIDFVISVIQNNFDNVYKVIIVDQDGEFPIPLGGSVLGGSILLPPYEILSMFLEGNPNGFRASYYDYLEFNQHTKEYMTTIMASLYLGNQIVMYLKPDLATEFPVQEVLLSYLWNRYNIAPTLNGQNPCMIHNTDQLVADAYQMGVINGWTYLNEFNGPIGSNNELNLLMMEFNPYMNPNPTVGDVINYFEQLRTNLRGSKQEELIMPISRKRD